MDAAKLQGKVYAGYGKAALRIGFMTDLYRPSVASNPLASGNKVASFNASFNAEDMSYSKPNKYGHPTWYGVFDARGVQVGDYLTNAQDGTYFVAALQTILPVLLVQCNRTIDVRRPQLQAGVGAVGYGGNTDAAETPLLVGWPASVLQGTKGERAESNLPGDSRAPWWSILLPAFPGVTIAPFDVVTDDLQRRYVISSAELTDLGWRITASQAVT